MHKRLHIPQPAYAHGHLAGEPSSSSSARLAGWPVIIIIPLVTYAPRFTLTDETNFHSTHNYPVMMITHTGCVCVRLLLAAHVPPPSPTRLRIDGVCRASEFLPVRCGDQTAAGSARAPHRSPIQLCRGESSG